MQNLNTGCEILKSLFRGKIGDELNNIMISHYDNKIKNLERKISNHLLTLENRKIVDNKSLTMLNFVRDFTSYHLNSYRMNKKKRFQIRRQYFIEN